MKILAFAASSSTQSINRKLINYASQQIESGLLADAAVNIIDLNDYEMPIYSTDRERDGGIPAAAHSFFEAIGQADALLISFAEHNGFYTAAYKNLFDWTSRIAQRVYQDKPTVMLATSPGRGGGANVLKTAIESAPHFGNLIKGSLSLPRFGQIFDTERGVITDPDLDGRLKAELAKLATDE